VCTESDEGLALDLHSSLVDKSLLSASIGWDGEPRFSMLETLRSYALEHLERSGDGEAFGRRHLDFFLELADTTEVKLSGPTEADALRQLVAEQENLRAALEYARVHGLHAVGLQLAAALGDFWLLHGDLSEARHWLEALLAHVGDGFPELRAKGLNKLGRIAFTQGELDRAQACFAESLSLYESIGDLERVGMLLGNLGAAMYESGATEAAATLFARSLAVAQETGDTAGVAYAYNNLGEVAVAAGELEAGEKYFADSLALLSELGHRDRVAASLLNTGWTALEGGQAVRAFDVILQALRLLCELGERIPEVPSSLVQLARASVELGDYPLAARIMGAAEYIVGEGVALLPHEATDLGRLRVAVRDELGEAAFRELLEAGGALSMADLIEQAATARATLAETSHE
jgi:tetratricopeptide (TPR) repeat protein